MVFIGVYIFLCGGILYVKVGRYTILQGYYVLVYCLDCSIDYWFIFLYVCYEVTKLKNRYCKPNLYNLGHISTLGEFKTKSPAILIVLVGIPGCGKTTWISNHLFTNDIVLSSDAIREELSGDANDQRVSKQAFDILEERAVAGLKTGSLVCIDATNTTIRARRRWLNLVRHTLEDYYIKMELICFLTPFDECVSRNQNRERVVPLDVLKRMHNQLFVSLLSIQTNEDWDEVTYILD